MTRESSDGSNLDPERNGIRDPDENMTSDRPVNVSGGGGSDAGGKTAADPSEGSITSELAWLGRGFFQPLYKPAVLPCRRAKIADRCDYILRRLRHASNDHQYHRSEPQIELRRG